MLIYIMDDIKCLCFVIIAIKNHLLKSTGSHFGRYHPVSFEVISKALYCDDYGVGRWILLSLKLFFPLLAVDGRSRILLLRINHTIAQCVTA